MLCCAVENRIRCPPISGNRTRITYPDSKVVDYTYDDANRMSTVTDWLSKVTTYGYDDAGRVTSTSLQNGLSEARSCNAANQLTSIMATKDSTTLTSLTYTLDDAGVRTAVEDLAGTESYTYDDLYRLTGVTYADDSSETYTYDGVGNRLTKTQGGTTSYTHDDADRLTAIGGTSYGYDDNGNQTARGTDSFTRDYENRLTAATVGGASASYVCRGDDLRHTKTVGGNTTTYTWDVNSSLPVVLQDGTYTYVYGLGLISQTDGSGNQSYFLGNGLSSTEMLTDRQGNSLGAFKYAVEGTLRSQGVTGSTEYLFAAQQYDADLGMYYLRARYYDPEVARFISKDPFPGFLVSPASLHPYSYAWNNPTNRANPSGLDTRGVGLAGSGGGAGLGVAGGVMVVWDDNGKVGILLSWGGGGYTVPTASVGVAYQQTGSADICNLPSPTVYSGISGGESLGAGVDWLVSSDANGRPYHGQQFQLGWTAKAPLPLEYHGGLQIGYLIPLRRVSGP